MVTLLCDNIPFEILYSHLKFKIRYWALRSVEISNGIQQCDSRLQRTFYEHVQAQKIISCAYSTEKFIWAI